MTDGIVPVTRAGGTHVAGERIRGRWDAARKKKRVGVGGGGSAGHLGGRTSCRNASAFISRWLFKSIEMVGLGRTYSGWVRRCNIFHAESTLMMAEDLVAAFVVHSSSLPIFGPRSSSGGSYRAKTDKFINFSCNASLLSAMVIVVAPLYALDAHDLDLRSGLCKALEHMWGPQRPHDLSIRRFIFN